MEAVLIDSNPFDSYRTVPQATTYLAAALHAGVVWSGATTDNKARALVTATRIIDRQRWEPAYDTQAERLAEPRILDACCEMALALLDGSDLQSEQTTAQKLQSISAGSVSLSYFRGAEGHPRRFPTIVDELLRDLLLGGSSGSGYAGIATGTAGQSVTDDDFGHTGGV